MTAAQTSTVSLHRPSRSQTPAPSVAAKAYRLLAQRRVIIGPRYTDRALVIGDTATYTVVAYVEGVTCSCPAGANTLISACAHKVAFLVAVTEIRERKTP